MITLRRLVARDDRVETWLGEDEGRRVVVERLRAELSVDAAAVSAVVQAMGRVPHHGIERAVAFEAPPPTWVFASDDAVALADLVRMGGGGLPTEVALVVVHAVAVGLAALDREVRARPRLAIPPERIRIGRDSGVRLQDPGFLAALARVDGGPRGADRAFAAPELLDATGPATDRAEVFALGALLHVLVAERGAWSPDRRAVVLAGGLEEDVRALLLRALALVPAQRPSWVELIEALEAALAERGALDREAVLGSWLAEVAASRVVVPEAERAPDPFDAEAWLAGFTAARAPGGAPAEADQASAAIGARAVDVAAVARAVDVAAVARPSAPRRPTQRLDAAPVDVDATTTHAGARPDHLALPALARAWDEDTTPAAPSPARPALPSHVQRAEEAQPTQLVARKTKQVSDDPLLGLVLHGYRLERALGQGAFSRVYLGQHLHLDRRAAVKILRGNLAASKVARRRMAREANALASVRHPHLVALLDFGMAPSGLPFLVTELLEGHTLEWSMQHQPRRAPAEVARLGAELARGLAAAHAVGVVHRDLKPANVMLVGGSAKLLDFGVARMNDGPTRLTELDDLVGTPLYMAPEQIRGASSADPSADLYSLGVVLYQVATGQPPFTGNLSQVIHAHLELAPPPLPPLGGLERVIMQLLAKTPAARPPSAEATAGLLEALSGRAPSSSIAGVTAPAVPIADTRVRPRAPSVAEVQQTPAVVRRARLEAWVTLAVAVGALALAVWGR